jgi:hypothetical protein
MKKVFLFSASIIVLLMISAGIVESISVLMHDINAHAWQTLIGRWQSYEQAFYEIEFTPVGTFVEYSYGISRSTGTLQLSGNTIILIYDAPYCTSREKNSCKRNMEFEFYLDTLILINQGKRIRFKRVEFANELMFGFMPNDPVANLAPGSSCRTIIAR